MKCRKGIPVKRSEVFRVSAVSACVAAAIAPGCAMAFQFNLPSDWQVNWDNTVTYNVGMRTQGIDPLIGNNPIYDNGDYKFGHAGDIVTNRASVLSEFDAVYQNRMGIRLSASLWKDFAYGSGVNSNPGVYAPGGGGLPPITYQSISGYPGGKYNSYTNRYYVQGAQLLDAFVFDNFHVGETPVYFKVGRLTEYWGNSLFFPFQGISVGQGAVDAIKASASPGTETKELFLPRAQVSISTQLTPELSLAGQYFLEYDRNRLPEGGTYLGPVDFLFQGPSNFFLGAVPVGGGYVPFNLPAGTDNVPHNLDNNFGVKLGWTPDVLNGGLLGLYYRRYDETQPWAPLFNYGANGVPTDYHLAYNRGVQLIGASLDTTMGNVSTGFEVSYRHNTALNSNPNPLVPTESSGATGNVVNIIANAIVPLSRSPFWQTGSFTAELAYTRLLSVTSNALLYNGVGYAGCSGGKWNGCSTRDHVALAIAFQPQWLQVFPGVDLSMPISDVIGLYGNAPQVGANSNEQGSHTYSIGLQATIRQKTTVTLAYNGSFAHANGVTYTPSGLPYYASGNGLYSLNDRNWVSLTLQSSF
ncbi:DUF1302 family protein [Paraburkholderia sp. CNPSo 3281]|uniref:DUF1302 domain-containing protein n=1 Tax=Paraburkholderia sp. CNPSo 3281 TaxID=2940933 RepID=UPI0020B8A13C|nr:DUF1302 family protein [Paraburkholderia sp. CNPSo 3281]MCP3720619.1 DUF1302 domain-containing protein [Paraburkholderia sp. CNPSo 3281]